MNRSRLLRLFLLVLILGSNPSFSQGSPNPDLKSLLGSVVIVRSDIYPDPTDPLEFGDQDLSRDVGSGFIIAGNKILTNAHVISESKYLKVKHFNSSKYYNAKVEFLGFDCDLALISVDDDEFFAGVEPLDIADDSPSLGSNLLMLGYPEGGENLTLENGLVNRIERIRYSFTGLDYRKVIRVGANILPGYSGGPALQNGKVAGIIFEVSQVQGSTAYLIPPEVVQHFLKDIQDGKYDGFPFVGFTFQNGTSEAIKQFLKIPDGLQGILVNKVYPNSSFSDVLQTDDFLYKIDDAYLNNEGGLLEFTGRTVVDLIEPGFVGQKLTLYFYRNGKNFKTQAELKRTDSLELYRDRQVRNFLGAGLLFQPVNRALFGKESQRVETSLRYHYSYFIQDDLFKFTERDLILTTIFPDPLNSKYMNYRFKILESINGKTPQNIEDFKELWKRYSGGTLVLKFRGVGLPLILDTKTIKIIDARVRKRFDIKSDEYQEASK
ncbi:serine protease [Leptospira langatensis]|uniref:Serine protease n=1 Tax=Leptospira langatensis TaxID=2484983 RepID=A0A5F1ZWD3_9LEPT|nr:trypsin-like peptidase domain-containing protein [Leptospira langatensis]TGJ98261.1 serine protease [Leptospira langatensis]TGL43175.1 serine protease [Leptospira langatensis]